MEDDEHDVRRTVGDDKNKMTTGLDRVKSSDNPDVRPEIEDSSKRMDEQMEDGNVLEVKDPTMTEGQASTNEDDIKGKKTGVEEYPEEGNWIVVKRKKRIGNKSSE